MRTQKTSFIGIMSFCLGLTFWSTSAQAQAKAPVKPSGTTAKPDQVDISDIENKYWAPKDTDFNVVQNRTYTKEKRFAISGQYGPVISETLNEGHAFTLGANYYFNERWGLQLNYTKLQLNDSDATSAFIKAGGGPDYGRVSNYYDLGLNWVPIYAKMSLIGKKIIYFDMAFTPIIGMMNYEGRTRNLGNFDKSALTYGFDVTQLFFLHQNFALKVDLKQRYYKEEIFRYYTSGGINEGEKLRTKNSDSTTLVFGAAVFF